MADEDIVHFYGPSYTQCDFAQLNLYRDVGIFDEVARLAKLVCSDLDASIGDFVSVDRWATVVRRTRARRLGAGNEDLEDRKRNLLEIVLDLNKHQLEKLATTIKMSMQSTVASKNVYRITRWDACSTRSELVSVTSSRFEST